MNNNRKFILGAVIAAAASVTAAPNTLKASQTGSCGDIPYGQVDNEDWHGGVGGFDNENTVHNFDNLHFSNTRGTINGIGEGNGYHSSFCGA